jgi:hypothetical protein
VTESRQEFLARVAEAHDAWVAQHGDSVEFDPNSRPDSGDYNMWHVDMDADEDAQAEFMDAVGPIPTTFTGDDLPESDDEPEPGEEGLQ